MTDFSFIQNTLSKRSILRTHRLICGLFSAILLVSAAAADSVNTLTHFGFESESYSPEAREGLKEIMSGRMFNASVPLAMIKGRETKASEMREQLGYDAATPEGRFYREGALPSLPGETDPNLHLGLSKFDRNGASLVSINCFMCHAGVVNGTVVAGMGSNSVMQPSGNLPGRGDNYGQYAVWLLAARVADPANTGLRTSGKKTPLVELVESTPLPPIQPMPWWVMKYKVRDYWYGDGAPTDAAHFSLNFTISTADVNERHAAHVASTAKALAFARETQSPIYPGTLDAARVQLGADIFHGRKEPTNASAFKACYECHGTYTKKPGAAELSKTGGWEVDYDGSEALRNVGTDPAYNEVIHKFSPIVEHLAKLEEYYIAQGTPELYPRDEPLKGKGYIPPPLVGVWATGPYFHNGSVPTVEAVLDSKVRPEIWARHQSPHAYDLDKLGMEFTVVARAEYDAGLEKARAADSMSKDAIDQTFIYDTKAFGRGNSGHTFGDSLTTEERAAVIEFLKSLSGPDM